MRSEHDAFCKDFWRMWIAKLLRTFLSVKVWTIVSMCWIATWLLTRNLIGDTQWATIMISGIVAIVISRSAFQIASLKNGNNEKKE